MNMEYEPQLPKTAKCLQDIEEAFRKLICGIHESPISVDPADVYEALSEEERHLIDNPMLHLAEEICIDTDSDEHGGWAVDLAKFILLITHYKED